MLSLIVAGSRIQWMQRLGLVACLTLFLAACARVEPRPAGAGLPEQCLSGCVTPYAQALGTEPGGVAAYSNCSARCVVFDPNRVRGVYTGIRWQCVEYARRWLLDHHGVVYGDVDTAADIWDKIQSVTRMADGREIPLRTLVNGSVEPPKAGDLLIYASAYLGTGHVAVVTAVDQRSGRVLVAEQNFLNRKWPGDYARRLDLVRHDGRWWILDPYLLGWKRLARLDSEAPVSSPESAER